MPSWLAHPFPLCLKCCGGAGCRTAAYLRSWQKAKKMMPAISATPAITPIACSSGHGTAVNTSHPQMLQCKRHLPSTGPTGRNAHGASWAVPAYFPHELVQASSIHEMRCPRSAVTPFGHTAAQCYAVHSCFEVRKDCSRCQPWRRWTGRRRRWRAPRRPRRRRRRPCRPRSRTCRSTCRSTPAQDTHPP